MENLSFHGFGMMMMMVMTLYDDRTNPKMLLKKSPIPPTPVSSPALVKCWSDQKYHHHHKHVDDKRLNQDLKNIIITINMLKNIITTMNMLMTKTESRPHLRERRARELLELRRCSEIRLRRNLRSHRHSRTWTIFWQFWPKPLKNSYTCALFPFYQ